MTPCTRSGCTRALLVPLAAFAVTSACASEDLQSAEPSASEREVLAQTLLDELSVEGALLDDSPPLYSLSAIAPTARGPDGMSAIAAPADDRTWPFTRPLDKLLRAWGVSLPSSCTTLEGTWSDSDDDGIPSAASVLFDCTSPTYGVSGVGYVADDNDGDPRGGFVVGLQNLRVETRGVGAEGAVVTTRSVNGSFVAYMREAPILGVLDVKIDLRTTLERSIDGQPSTALIVKSTGITTYFPDADLPAASRSQRGDVTSSVKTTLTEQGIGHTWSRTTGVSLRWNLDCKIASAASPGFDGGEALYADDRGNTVRIAFTSCAAWSTTLSGAPI